MSNISLYPISLYPIYSVFCDCFIHCISLINYKICKIKGYTRKCSHAFCSSTVSFAPSCSSLSSQNHNSFSPQYSHSPISSFSTNPHYFSLSDFESFCTPNIPTHITNPPNAPFLTDQSSNSEDLSSSPSPQFNPLRIHQRKLITYCFNSPV